MRRTLTLALLLSLGATTGFAQSRLNGKWMTDRPSNPQAISDAERRQSVQLDVAIENSKASGTLALGGLGGTFYTFKDGKVTGDKVEFQVDLQPPQPTWTIEMVDDNTVMLYRGSLPLVGNNVLDLLAVLGTQGPPAAPVQVATAAQAGANPPISNVSQLPLVGKNVLDLLAVLGTQGPLATPVQVATPAQVGLNPSISGVVQDPTRAIMPGVSVTATNIDSGAKLTTMTNDAGRYSFLDVTPGRYTVTASLPGFRTTTVSDLNINTQFVQDLTLDLTGARAPATPTASSCNRSGIQWCAILHRAK